MSRNLQDYLNLVPPLNANQTRFIAELSLLLQPFCDAQALLNNLPAYFDLDNAIGAQLDIDGKWVGRSRNLTVPLQNCFFSLGDPLRGLGKGVWRDNNNPGITFTKLDDETYRRLLKAKAIANEWDGTVADGQTALDQFWAPTSGTVAFIDDGGWSFQGPAGPVGSMMEMTIGVSGTIPSVVELEVLAQNLIGLKPATVNVNYAITSINGAPLFGLGVNNQYVGGLGYGALAVDPDFILSADASLLSPG